MLYYKGSSQKGRGHADTFEINYTLLPQIRLEPGQKGRGHADTFEIGNYGEIMNIANQDRQWRDRAGPGRGAAPAEWGCWEVGAEAQARRSLPMADLDR
jgi:hypothetical protein